MKGVRLAVLLSHEQERHEGREQEHRGRDLAPLEAHEGREPLAAAAIGDLVVVLQADDELLAGPAARGGAVPPAAVGRVLTRVDEAVAERPRQLFHPAEVLVVAVALARQRGVQGVVPVVDPLRRHPQPAFFR